MDGPHTFCQVAVMSSVVSAVVGEDLGETGGSVSTPSGKRERELARSTKGRGSGRAGAMNWWRHQSASLAGFLQKEIPNLASHSAERVHLQIPDPPRINAPPCPAPPLALLLLWFLFLQPEVLDPQERLLASLTSLQVLAVSWAVGRASSGPPVSLGFLSPLHRPPLSRILMHSTSECDCHCVTPHSKPLCSSRYFKIKALISAYFWDLGLKAPSSGKLS